MNTTTAIIIAVVAVIVLGALAFMTLARRSDVRGAGALSDETKHADRSHSGVLGAEGTASAAAKQVERAGALARRGDVATTGGNLVELDNDTGLTPWTPPDPEKLDVTRRQFFNRAIVGLMGASLGSFAAASFVAFLWPTATGGFGGIVPIGRLNTIRDGIVAGNGFFYAPEARAWITPFPADAISKAIDAGYQEALLPGLEAGIIASYQKCPHLGCRVPQCVSSQWFECGCHGSQYNRVGEKKAGPAPRGMDHFALNISAAGDVAVDTGTVWQGQPIGVNTTGQEAEGPHCVGGGDH